MNEPLWQRAAFGCLVLLLLFLTGCVYVTPTRLGCKDVAALNYEPWANMDDGTCVYSSILFYSSTDEYEYVPNPAANQLFLVPIKVIAVSLESVPIGKIRSFLPDTPASCAAVGGLRYRLTQPAPVEWQAVISLKNGASIVNGGTISPHQAFRCIALEVTTGTKTFLN